MTEKKTRMIIDAHSHPDWHGHNMDKTIANMDQFRIDKTWLLTWESPRDEYNWHFGYATPSQILGTKHGPIPFCRALSYVERAPDRFVLGYAPDPREPEAIDKLQAGVEIYGVRVCGELKLRMMYDNRDAIRMFKFCGEKKLPVTIHIDYEFDSGSKYPRPNYWYGGGIDAFERAIRQCPETIFLGHAPGYWAHISGDDRYDKESYPDGPVEPGGKVPEMLRNYPNLYCDLSAGSARIALSRDPVHAKEFIDEFQDRLLYARDCFDNKHQEFINSLDLSQEILDKIYYQNALKLVPL